MLSISKPNFDAAIVFAGQPLPENQGYKLFDE